MGRSPWSGSRRESSGPTSFPHLVVCHGSFVAVPGAALQSYELRPITAPPGGLFPSPFHRRAVVFDGLTTMRVTGCQERPLAATWQRARGRQQSESVTALHSVGQQPSFWVPEQRRIGTWAQAAEQLAADPTSWSTVHGSPSLGQLVGQVEIGSQVSWP